MGITHVTTAKIAANDSFSEPYQAHASTPNNLLSSDSQSENLVCHPALLESSLIAPPPPRYTSYPTPEYFVESLQANHYQKALAQRNTIHKKPLSLYIHLPFSEQLCYSCAYHANTVRVTGEGKTYLRYLEQEISLVSSSMEADRHISAMHWGGGTPTYLRSNQLKDLSVALKKTFSFSSKGVYTIDVAPSAVDQEKLQTIADIGFNQLNIAVQDFDARVQSAIHRTHTLEHVTSVVDMAAKLGINQFKFDLVFGLPHQSASTAQRTMDHVIGLRPSRVTLYPYCHQPSAFSALRNVDPAAIPNELQRREIFETMKQGLCSAGYLHIGLDNFVLPQHDLSAAFRGGYLRRGLHGFTTQPESDFVAFGVGAISQVGHTLFQNARTVQEYIEHLEGNTLAVSSGVEVERDDMIRKVIIMMILCHNHICMDTINDTFIINFEQYFSVELDQLKLFEKLGMVVFSDSFIEITDAGRDKALRQIAALFDCYYQRTVRNVSHSHAL